MIFVYSGDSETQEDYLMNDHAPSTKNRRIFLQSLSAGVGGLLAQSNRVLAADSPNERIRVGFIGLGGMGTERLRGFMRYDDVEVAGVCDVDSSHLEKAIAEVEARKGYKPEGYRDFRKLLERKDVDAVVVTTPDHWHALITILACKAGKDVFVEKPLCHNIAEGRRMMNAAVENQRITQLGTHIHNDIDNYRRVVEMIQSGNIGRITRVQCWKNSDKFHGATNPPDCAPPAELDYNFWLGPAPMRPYNPNRSHFNFRYFWDYSGGTFMDFWCHITDVAYWSLGLKAPLSVSAVGARRYVYDDTETPNCLDVLYEFPDLTLAWTVNPTPPAFQHMGGIGCIFYGSRATLVTNYTAHEIWVDGKKVDDFPRPEPTIPNSPGHIREFLDSIKSRQKTTCNIEYAYNLTKGGLLGNIAYRTGERIYWDDERERITNSPKANALIQRKYRSPWKLA